jgi:hypothetical protein
MVHGGIMPYASQIFKHALSSSPYGFLGLPRSIFSIVRGLKHKYLKKLENNHQNTP